MEFESAQSNTTAKLPILKLENGNSWVSVPQTSQENGTSVIKMSIPVTAKEKTNKKNDVKARSLLLMALPNEHQLTFSQYSDAKTIPINIAYPQVSTANFSDNTMYAFMVENPNGSNLLQQDLEQINKDDLEAMDLKTAGIDKSKVECFNCHKMGHFASECKAPRNKEGQFRYQDNTRKQGNNEDTSSKAMLDIDGVVYDWSEWHERQVPDKHNSMAVNYNYTTNRTHPNAQRNMVPRAVLMKTGLKPFNTARTVNTAQYPKSTVLMLNQWQANKMDTGFIDMMLKARDWNITYLTSSRNLMEVMFTLMGGSTWYTTQKEESVNNEHCVPIWKDASYFDSPPNDVIMLTKTLAADYHKPLKMVHIMSSEWKKIMNTVSLYELDSPKDMFKLGASHTLETTHIEFFSDEDEPEVDLGNITNSYTVPTTPNTRIHKDHPIENVIGDVKSFVQTRRMTKPTSELGFLSAVYEQKTHDTLNTCLYACFLSQIEPTSIAKALSNSSWVEAMQEELLQEEGIEYEEVFAPVARIEAITLFLAYASFVGFLVYQMDMKSAFLYGTIEEEVYVTQPLGFKDLNHPDKVYKVVKALYRLHQAPRAWYETLANYLLGNGFKRGKIDQTLFIKKQKEDILLVQDKYLAEILKRFNYIDVKSASTLVDLEKPLVKDGDVDGVDVHLYRSMIGSLMYLTSSIMFAVCACARFQVTPKTSYLLAVKRIFRYLKGKPTLGLWYSRDSPFELVAYTNGDFAGATQDRKSTTGCCQFLGNRLISWECKKQTMVATSTTEAEYLAAAYLLTKGFDAGRIKTSWHVKRGRDTNIPRSSGPPVKVGDEAVHKELGDRMKRVVTTASSLEAEHDSDTILRDVDAQTRFETTSKQSNDPPLSRGYTLGSGEDINAARPNLMLQVQVIALRIRYTLTVNTIIYTSCIQQFWATAKANTVNGERQLQALVDKKRVIITESSIRSDLHLEEAGGTDCLPTATIFEELLGMGLSAKTTAWNEFSSTMASAIICLATNQKFNFSKHIFDAMLGDMSHHKKIHVNPSHTKKIFSNMKREGKDFSKRLTPLFATMMVQPNQEEGIDSGIPTNHHQTPITTQPLSSRSQKKQSKRKQRKDTAVTQEETQQDDSVPTPSNDPPFSKKAKDAQAKEIPNLKKRVHKLERKKKSRPTGLKRLRKVGMSRRVKSSEDNESLGDHEDASKQERSIEDIDKDVDVSLVDDTQGRSDDAEMLDDKVVMDITVGEKQEQSATEREVNTSVANSAAPTTIEEITLAQTLIQIKAAKPKVVTTVAITTTTTRPKAIGVVVQEPSEFRIPQESQPSMIKDKGKPIMIEPEVPL
ncbi:uncharacterized mitochondrial protein-like protein [Tanacetum coccineum]